MEGSMERLPLSSDLVDTILSFIKVDSSSRRYERKFKLYLGQSLVVESELRQLGFYEAFKPREVSSIYFDNEKFSFAKHNIDGERYRLKPRLRWYGDNYCAAKLELKFRDGFNGYKNVYSDFGFLGTTQSLSNSIRKISIFLNKFQSLKNLRPSSKVTYQRRYFLHPSGIRATIDTHIYVESISSDMHQSKNQLPIGFEVLEIKYTAENDNYVREYIYPHFIYLSMRLTKCSKYVESILTLSDNIQYNNN
jgi:hypothetical protein